MLQPASSVSRPLRVAAVALIAAGLGSVLLPAVTRAAAPGTPTLPGRPCATPGLPEWTAQEKWVWKRVCEGELADFNEQPGYGGDLDPREPEGWPESRVLRPEFLETILLHEPFRGAQTRRGVRIVGAWFREAVDLVEATVARELWLTKGRFDRGASLLGLRAASLLNLGVSKFTGTLDLDGAQVEGTVFLGDGAEFAEVDLRSAHIGGQLTMSGSKFTGKLNLNSAWVEGSLFLDDGAEFAEVVLRGARIGGQLSMMDSKFTGTLDLNNTEVGSSLFARRADLSEAALVVPFLVVRGSLDLRGAQLSRVDLRGAAIGGELRLADGSSEPVWAGQAMLDLRHATVRRLRARPGAGSAPQTVLLEGLSYDALGGFGEDPDRAHAEEAEALTSTREAADFVESWLRREPTHSPRAHEQFARVLREAGLPRRARNTLYEGKNHELGAALRSGDLGPAAGLAAQWALIGYGHRLWRSLWWIVGLIVVGSVVARRSGVTLPGSGERLGFWFSLDRLLPIVRLRDGHYKVDLPGWRQVYFYLHALMGWVLATFLVAAVSGLVG